MNIEKTIKTWWLLPLSAIAIGAGSIGLQAPVGYAQLPDHGANPLYGTVQLGGDFARDPHRVQVQAGGGTDARNLGLPNSCVGFIARSQPDARINYRATDYKVLSFYVTSNSDTTLIINGPDGRWYCNDDMSGSTVNPRVIFDSPRSGQYDVWVGTYGTAKTESANLYVSERGNPLYGSLSLNAGFTPDPHRVNIQAGGNTDVQTFNVGSSCVGYIAIAQPDLRVNYQAGRYQNLSFAATANTDTTLVIHGPDGRWYCNDDFEGTDPKVIFNSPASGRYDIWVGTYGQAKVEPAQIHISEM